MIASGVVPVVRLIEVFRQSKDSRIITTAHEVNHGKAPSPVSGSAPDSDFYFLEREDPEQITGLMSRLIRERIPRRLGVEAIRDIQVLCPMHRGSLGARGGEPGAARSTQPRSSRTSGRSRSSAWTFRVGDKVIQMENNYDKNVFNGDMGRIEMVDPLDKGVAIRFESQKVIYDFNELDQLAPGFAISIHKSQGSEFPVVVIPLAMQQYLLLQRKPDLHWDHSRKEAGSGHWASPGIAHGGQERQAGAPFFRTSQPAAGWRSPPRCSRKQVESERVESGHWRVSGACEHPVTWLHSLNGHAKTNEMRDVSIP